MEEQGKRPARQNYRMSNSARSRFDWTNHLAQSLPDIMTSSKALQILVGTNNAVPFDRPLPFPFAQPRNLETNTETEKKDYLHFVKRPGGSWEVEKGVKSPIADRKKLHKDFTKVNEREEDLCGGINVYSAKHVLRRKEGKRHKMTMPSQDVGNNEANIRQNNLRKVAAMRAASLINNEGHYMRNTRNLSIGQPASGLRPEALKPALDARPDSSPWKMPNMDNLRVRNPFPWKISGIGRTMLSWQEHLFHLPKGKGRSPPTNQVPVSEILFMRTRPHDPEILLFMSESMKSDILTNVNFVRIPYSYVNACRDTSTFLEGQITDSWIFIYIANLARLRQHQHRSLAPAHYIDGNEASWSIVAFPTVAISRSFETRTTDGRKITRYELCKSGRWPLVDGDLINISGWLPWVNAVAVGAAALEFKV